MPTNDIGQDRFQARLTKELRIKGSMPAPVLAPEIVPVLIVENERTENLHLQREHRFSCTLTLAGVANEFYYFQLWNPAGAHGIVVVEEFGLTDVASTGAVDFGYADVAVKASLGARDSFCLDTRVPGRTPRQGVALPFVGTDLGAGIIDVFGRTLCGTTWFPQIKPNVVLTPGYGFSIWCSVVQQGIAGYCFWLERQAEDGELIGP